MASCTACQLRIRDAARFCHGCGAAQWMLAPCAACGAQSVVGGAFCDQCGAAQGTTTAPETPAFEVPADTDPGRSLEATAEASRSGEGPSALSGIALGKSPSALPFVGRDETLSAFLAGGQPALLGEGPRVMWVSGPSGAGKSRLIHEGLRQLTFGAPDLVVGTARFGVEASAGALRPLLSALAPALTTVASTPAAAIDAVLEDHPEHPLLGPARAALKALAQGALKGRASAPDDARGLRETLVFGLTRLLVALSRRLPLVLVLHDIEAGSGLVRAVLRALVDIEDAGQDTRLLVVVESRPPLGADLASSPRVLHVPLGPLSDDAIGRLLAHVLGDAARDGVWLQQWAPPRAEGTPQYLLEYLRALAVDGRVVVDERGAVVAVGPDAGPRPPATIAEAVAAQHAALSPVERRVVQIAAAIGETFWARPVLSLLDEDDPHEVTAAIERLVRVGLFDEDSDKAAGGRRVLRFRSAAQCENAGIDALGASPARIAAAIADVLAATPGLSAPRRLAVHLERAGRHRELFWSVTQLLEDALSIAALDDAARWAKTGNTLLAQRAAEEKKDRRLAGPLRRARFHLAVAELHQCEGDLDAALSQLSQADAMLGTPDRRTGNATPTSDETLFGRVRELLADTLTALGRTDEAVPMYEAALSALPEQAIAERAQVEVGLALCRHAQGHHEVASTLSQSVHMRFPSETIELDTLRRAVGRLLAHEAQVHSDAGRYAEARATFDALRALAARGGRPRVEARALVGIGRSWQQAGGAGEAVRALASALKLWRDLGDDAAALDCALALADVHLAQRASEPARHQLAWVERHLPRAETPARQERLTTLKLRLASGASAPTATSE